MLHPFDQPRNLTPEQWKARARAIQARLEGLSVDDLMRGGRVGEPPHLGVRGPNRRGYDPSQPRAPAGHPDGGQWTDDDRADGGWTRLRGALQLAAAEGPPRNLRQLPPYLARKLIEAIHRELASWDLFGEHNPDKVTVAVTTIDGREFHGTSSKFGDGARSTTSKPENYALSSCEDIRTWQKDAALVRFPSMLFSTLKLKLIFYCALQGRMADLSQGEVWTFSSTTRRALTVSRFWVALA